MVDLPAWPVGAYSLAKLGPASYAFNADLLHSDEIVQNSRFDSYILRIMDFFDIWI